VQFFPFSWYGSNMYMQDKRARKLTKKRVRGIGYSVLFSLLILFQLGTLLRSKRKLEELSTIIQESRRAGH
jgi:large subunit ribosomal protein L36e